LIKSSYFPERDQELSALCSTDPRINIINQHLDEQQLLGLFAYAKCLVAPSRSEGFGMPGLEAAACGLPIVGVNYSGQTEYFRHLEGSLIAIDFDLIESTDTDFVRIYGNDFGETSFGTWAEPSVEDLILGLRRVFTNYDQLRLKAITNAKLIIEHYSWTETSKKTKAALNDLWVSKRP